MITRDEIFNYVKEQYGIEPDYPWARTPNFAILRHANSRKWFGAVMDLTGDKLGLASNRPVDAMNLKCDPQLVSGLRREPGIFPAYHMNKEHWITVLLDGTVPWESIKGLIDLSYELTK